MKILSNKQTCKLATRKIYPYSFLCLFLFSCGKESTESEYHNSKVESRIVPCNTAEYCTTTSPPTYYKKVFKIDKCWVRAEFKVVTCSNTTGSYAKFSEFSIKIIAGCMDRNENELVYNDGLNAFHKKVLEEVEKWYMTEIKKNPTSHNFIVEWLVTGCFKYCISKELVGEEIWDVFTRVKCGESCCKRVTPYTRGIGNVWIKGPTTVTEDAACTPVGIDAVYDCKVFDGTLLEFCNHSCAYL